MSKTGRVDIIKSLTMFGTDLVDYEKSIERPAMDIQSWAIRYQMNMAIAKKYLLCQVRKDNTKGD